MNAWLKEECCDIIFEIFALKSLANHIRARTCYQGKHVIGSPALTDNKVSMRYGLSCSVKGKNNVTLLAMRSLAAKDIGQNGTTNVRLGMMNY